MPFAKFASISVLVLVMTGIASSDLVAGEAVTYTYDSLGRLRVVSSSGTINDGQAYSYCYDGAGNRTLAKTDAAGTAADCTSVSSPVPSISIDDTSAIEGGGLLFSVTLDAPYASAVSVDYATAYGSAGATDFTAKSGTLTIPAGETFTAFAIATIQDTEVESAETFVVNLANATGGASISDGQGVGTIFDDDDGSCGVPPCT